MGGSGSGHLTKVLNNYLNGVTLAATAEVMVAGLKAGLYLAQLLEVINTSSGVSFASLNRFPHIIRGDYLKGGLTGQLMAKDVRLYLSLAGDLGVVTLIGPGTLSPASHLSLPRLALIGDGQLPALTPTRLRARAARGKTSGAGKAAIVPSDIPGGRRLCADPGSPFTNSRAPRSTSARRLSRRRRPAR